MAVERNEQGQLLLDPKAVAQEVVRWFSRYNGGWIKKIDQIDKSVTTGYSLVGPFVKDGLQWVTPGVYLDCSIDGSRRKPRRYYTVFIIRPDGSAEVVGEAGDTRDWAVTLWPVVEKAFAMLLEGDRDAKLAALRERREALLRELDEIERQIRELEA